LCQIEKLEVVAPEATFYMMVDISRTGMHSVDFCYALLQSAHVAVVPGITYGNSCDNFIRIAFTLDEADICAGVKRIKEFVNTL
jgi:aminotransferase